MDNKITISLLENSDVDETFDMIQKSLSTYALSKVYEDVRIETWRSLYSKKYIKGSQKFKHIYIAKINGKVVGSAASELLPDSAYISMVYINPDAQGKGIGKKLMQAIEEDEYCKKTGFITLSAALSAVKFYQKYGYHYKDNIPEIIVDCGIEFMHLEKKLNSI